MKSKTAEIRLQGTPISRGIAIGRPFHFLVVDDEPPVFAVAKKDIDKEVKRYMKALEAARREIQGLQKRLEKEHVAEGAAILEAHLQIMRDSLMTAHVQEEIRKSGKNAESAFQKVIRSYRKKFLALSDPLFRERFKDIEDISRRVMAHLLKSIRITLADIPSDSVVFARELTASDMAEAKRPLANALVTESGGLTSHAAIVAKARGIPYVTSVDFQGVDLNRASSVIVDGRIGQVIVNPSSETLARYESLKDQYDHHHAQLQKSSNHKVETFDGYSIKLSANIDLADDLEVIHEYGGEGVGLFRTEYLFMDKARFPSEEEQFEAYRSIVERIKGKPVVIRTFDIGGDKILRNQLSAIEENPFLGCRAIRFMLKDPETFKIQLRAILRASAFGDVRIMFPMISSLGELLEAKRLLKEAAAELKAEKIKHAKKIPVGSMIEVPSAAIIADLLAKECDFLSIGTNDLVQYSLAVDRGNHQLRELYTPSHPSVIRLIKMVVAEANHHGIPVCICGEVASDPRYTALLLGLGVCELSVATRYIPTVKNAIRNTSIVEASRIAEEVLGLPTAVDIQEFLDRHYQKSFTGEQYCIA